MTLNCFGRFGPKLNVAFQISHWKIGQFVSSCQKGYKFHILLLSFVQKVNCLNQNVWQEFYSVTLKGFTTFQPKVNAAFQISLTKNWSISFELPKRLQISYFIPFFCLKGKLLEPKSLGRVLFSDTAGI